MACSYIDAKEKKTEEMEERSPLDVELFCYVFVDGMAALSSANEVRRALNQGVEIKRGGKAISGYTKLYWENPSAKPSDSPDTDDETHIHQPFFVDFERFPRGGQEILNKLKQTKEAIRSFVYDYTTDKDVKSIKLHILLLFYNQNNIIVKILNPLTEVDELSRKALIKKIFEGEKDYLKHPKIKYYDIECLSVLDPIGVTDINKQGNTATFVSDSHDFKSVIIDRKERDEWAANAPTDEDIWVAACLSQNNYDLQTPIQQSIPAFVSGHVKNILTKILPVAHKNTSSFLSDVFSKETLESLLGDQPLDFNSKEGIMYSATVISKTIFNLISDLDTLTLLNIGMPPQCPHTLADLIAKGIPDTYKVIIDDLRKASNSTMNDTRLAFEGMLKEKIEQDKYLREHSNGIKIDYKQGYTVWDVVDKDGLKKLIGGKSNYLIEYSSGFHSVLYKQRGVDKYMYCTSGTCANSLADWLNNLTQGITGLSAQYSISVNIAKALDKALKGKKLFFIGHSLGGGLASNNALVTSARHAITFNAAGLSIPRVIFTLLINNRRDLFRIKKRKSKIHAYVIEGEVLNWLLKNLGEGAYGDKHILKQENMPDSDIWNIGHLGRHSIADTFLNIRESEELSIKKTSNIAETLYK